MLIPRPSSARGHFNHGWLNTYHSFSFADYYDPQWMGWGNLRVINEDWIAPEHGFGTHGHRDMEIVTYVLEGELAHKDSMGNGTSIPPGDVQRMSAGRGVMHSEFNHAPNATTHLLQIWIQPDTRGIEPGYEQRSFATAEKRGQLRVVASPDQENGAVKIHANARIYAGLFHDQESAQFPVAAGRKAYVHVVRGSLNVNDQTLQGGDALAMVNEPLVQISQGNNAEVLVFDLAA